MIKRNTIPWIVRAAIAAFVLAMAVFVPAHAAQAAPAAKSVASVVPAGCATSRNANAMRVNSAGQFLGWTSPYHVNFGYSTSGASVKMTSATIDNSSTTDSRTYQITTDRWETGDASTIYNGPGGGFGPINFFNWTPSSQLWLSSTSHPVWSVWGYDVNYPSVGVAIQARPCS